MTPVWTPEVAASNSKALECLAKRIIADEAARKEAKRAGKNPDAVNGEVHPSKAQQRSVKDDRYAQKALEDECKEVASASTGTRNSRLNRAAFYLGQLVAGGILDQQTVESRLFQAACDAGLDQDTDGIRGVRNTIKSGTEAGFKKPRSRPMTEAERAKEEVFGADGYYAPPMGVAEVPPFPTEVFPGLLERFAIEGAKSCRCPVDYFAAPMLVVAANMIGGSRCLQILDDWPVYPALYMALVGLPGSGKSPALSQVTQQIKRQHMLNLEEYKRAFKDWRAADPKTRGEKPAFERVYTTDSTGEKLAGVLQECPRGFMLYKDELTAWISGMDQYKSGGKGTERQTYLSCWSNQGFSVERKSNEDGIPISVHRPVLSVLGGIQPDLLPMLADSKGRADGFLDRILFCYPERVRRPWTWDGINPYARAAWRTVMGQLRVLRMVPGTEGEGKAAISVVMTDDAMKVWEGWQNAHEAEQEAEDFNPALYGPWAKMDSQLARIALTIQFLWHASGPTDVHPDDAPMVDTGAINSAALVVNYFKAHVRRSLGLIEVGQEERQVQKAVFWIRKRGGSCTLREVYTNHVAGVKKASDAEKLFELLADYGIGRVEVLKSENDKTVKKFTIAENR